MRTGVRTLASLSGLRIRHCSELWCGSQTRLTSRIAVAVAVAVVGSCSSDSIPNMGISTCCTCSPKKVKKKKKYI